MLIIIIAGIIILAIVLYVSGSRKREEAVWGDDFTAHMASKRAAEAAANRGTADYYKRKLMEKRQRGR